MKTATTSVRLRCPACELEIRGMTGPANLKPTPGDLSVCWHCAELLTVTEGPGLRVLGAAELDELDETTRRRLLAVQRGIRAVPARERRP